MDFGIVVLAHVLSEDRSADANRREPVVSWVLVEGYVSLAPDFSQVDMGDAFTPEPFQRFTPENR